MGARTTRASRRLRPCAGRRLLHGISSTHGSREAERVLTGRHACTGRVRWLWAGVARWVVVAVVWGRARALVRVGNHAAAGLRHSQRAHGGVVMLYTVPGPHTFMPHSGLMLGAHSTNPAGPALGWTDGGDGHVPRGGGVAVLQGWAEEAQRVHLVRLHGIT